MISSIAEPGAVRADRMDRNGSSGFRISRHPEGLDDDQVAQLLGLSQRQHANLACRDLERQRIVRRERSRGKIHNFLARQTGSASDVVVAPVQHAVEGGVHRPQADRSNADWFWEGAVQAAVVRHLASNGYVILRVADTRARETGKDIVASRDRIDLWVSVKGYPRSTERTPATLQAGHWFKGGFFDLVAWRAENHDVDLAYALPDFLRYRALATRVAWLQPYMRFAFFWVREDGVISVQPPSILDVREQSDTERRGESPP